MRQTVAEWRSTRGNVCVGYQRPPHPAGDLVADHLIPVSQGGEGGPSACSAPTATSDAADTNASPAQPAPAVFETVQPAAVVPRPLRS
jgi:hypothetical protein